MTARPDQSDSTLRRGFAAVLSVLLLVCPATAQSQGTSERLEQVEDALEASQSQSRSLDRQAGALQQEIIDLQGQAIEAAEKTQDLESRLTKVETALAELESRHAAKSAALRAQRGTLYRTLAALQRIAVQPAGAVLVSRGTPVERLRSALLLNAAIPEIEARAAGLREDLEEISALHLAIEQQHVALAVTAKALAEERANLSDLIGRKLDLHIQTLGERESAKINAERLAAEAKNLRDLLVRLEEQSRRHGEREARAQSAAELQAGALSPPESPALAQGEKGGEEEAYEGTRSLTAEIDGEPAGEGEETALASLSPAALAKPENVRPFPQGDAMPLLVMPARGRLVLAYGQAATGADSLSRGISIETRSQAQVVAPYDGQIVYAGEFRGYGQILIIEHGGRYHTLLAGLERIDAVAGQWILAGEPIGTMGSPADRPPELYLELRHAGQPVNPLPWLATTDDKVQG